MHPCKMQQRRHTIRSGKSAADPGKTSPVIKKNKPAENLHRLFYREKLRQIRRSEFLFP